MNEPSLHSPEFVSGFTLGPWSVEPSKNAISQGGDEKHLENRLMQTLVFLAEHQGRIISREQFFDSVWQGLVVNEEALSRAISLLRTALGDHTHRPEFIQTIPGVGYRLIAQVTINDNALATSPSAELAQKNSIAVLPFVNLSDDPANEYFSDGITEEILNVLAQVAGFKVVGRTSSFAFKDRNEDIREIGRTLNVTHVLEGSVRKADARVRITAQLIKSDDGFHLWSKSFDRKLNDIFAVQDEIASAVATALRVRLLGDEGNHLIIGGTSNPNAFQAYLLGVHHRNRGEHKEGLQNAINSFQQAIDLDPGYARAYVGLAFAWGQSASNGFVSQDEGVSKMDHAAGMALKLAPDLADSWLARGFNLIYHKVDPYGALKAISTALELKPGKSEVQIQYARIKCNLGDSETSIAAARKALELDPISLAANHFLGHVLYFARQYDEAIRVFRHVLELDPHFPKPHYFISMIHYWKGNTDAALKEIQLESVPWMKSVASTVFLHGLGRIEESNANFAALIAMGVEENNFFQQAEVYAQRGDADQAFKCLDVAFEIGDPGLSQFLIDPLLDPIRDDHRFIELSTKLGFKAV